jgi:hypothetical protein
MPIKFGEITVIHNDNEDGFFKSFFRNFGGYEFKTNENSKIIILFDDGEIIEINDKLNDFNYSFSADVLSPLPLYFKTSQKIYKTHFKTYFKKQPELNTKSQPSLNFDSFFANYSKYSKKNNIPSAYNCLYYSCTSNDNTDVFGIVRIKSTESKPRFQFAYDCLNFSKDEIIYLINTIFKNKIES